MRDPRRFLVGGEWRRSEEIAEIRFPYSGEVADRVYLAGDADIEDALRSAAEGFSLTRTLPSHRRSEILYALADRIHERSPELVDTIVLEAGKTRTLADGEVQRARETIEVSAEEARRIDGTILPLDWTEAGEGRVGYLRRFPLGPVLAVTPFNFPFNLACHKLGPAIAAGNSVILKPASATPVSALMLGEMVLKAGFPSCAISVVPCPAPRAERMVRDDRIAYVSFTGSPDVGWHLKAISGRKRIGLELGGNAAVIVHEDADIPHAVSRIAIGGFSNAGQICISVQRVFLHRPIYDEALALLVDRVRALTTGDPRQPGIDIGPMISRAAASAAYAAVQEAVDKGARVLVGGTCDGTLFAPTVLVDTTPSMRVNRTEIFAPVITVTPYETFDEAIALANDSDFGLQAGLFTRDAGRIHRAFSDLRVGGLIVNDISAFRMDHMPYGGVKDSGLGREGPRYAIHEMTEERLMVYNGS
jgi:acyl-CoA reductase-like NAD-dependent aldehyde dehydrogenase